VHISSQGSLFYAIGTTATLALIVINRIAKNLNKIKTLVTDYTMIISGKLLFFRSECKFVSCDKTGRTVKTESIRTDVRILISRRYASSNPDIEIQPSKCLPNDCNNNVVSTRRIAQESVTSLTKSVFKMGWEENANKGATRNQSAEKLQINSQTALTSVDPGEMGKEMIA